CAFVYVHRVQVEVFAIEVEKPYKSHRHGKIILLAGSFAIVLSLSKDLIAEPAFSSLLFLSRVQVNYKNNN
ncbi:hypothetical protein, partial [Vibrio pectenicida]|uniref:hypothetical protein n=1 Tax=Vibrio pectenicida TaxID=62763 RepID=UPI001C0F98B8